MSADMKSARPLCVVVSVAGKRVSEGVTIRLLYAGKSNNMSKDVILLLNFVAD